MQRRKALNIMGLLVGYGIIGESLLLSGCQPTPKNVTRLFTTKDVALLDDIAETILPATNTPGARESKLGAFICMMATDCYPPATQKIFIDGLAQLNKTCEQQYGHQFIDCKAAEKESLLKKMDDETMKYLAVKKPEDPPHFFGLLKDLTIFGFFTSEPGATKVLRYIAIPGKYLGDVPYKKGDKAWATY